MITTLGMVSILAVASPGPRSGSGLPPVERGAPAAAEPAALPDVLEPGPGPGEDEPPLAVGAGLDDVRAGDDEPTHCCHQREVAAVVPDEGGEADVPQHWDVPGACQATALLVGRSGHVPVLCRGDPRD